MNVKSDLKKFDDVPHDIVETMAEELLDKIFDNRARLDSDRWIVLMKESQSWMLTPDSVRVKVK